MPSSMYDNDINNSRVTWEKFLSYIKKDIEELVNRRKEIEAMKKRADIFGSILENEKRVIEEKSMFIELEPALEEDFKKLEFFAGKDNLRNKMAKAAFDRIVSNAAVKEASVFPAALNSELKTLREEIKLLNDALDGKLSVEFIIDKAKLHEMDDEEIKQILFYRFYKSTKLADVALGYERANAEAIANIPTAPARQVEEEHEDVVDVIGGIVLPNQEFINGLDETKKVKVTDESLEKLNSSEVQVVEDNEYPSLENPVEKKAESESKQRYDLAKEKHEALKKEHQSLIDKYYNSLQGVMSYYSSYSRTPIDEVYQMGLIDSEVSKIIACKLFDCMKGLDEAVSKAEDSIANDITNADYDCDYAVEYMDEFEKILNELIDIDEKVIDGALESTMFTNSKLYFAHDNAGNPIIPKEDIYRKKIETFSNKLGHDFAGNTDAKSMRLPNSEKESDFLGKRTIYMLLTSPSLSYVKINVNNEESRFILTANQRLKMTSSTSDLISDYGDEILNQIKLIEANDPQEMQVQSSIRKSFGLDEMSL